ncbi:hypothetical protein CP08DC60_0530B, partial [Chlamydia psittaci 08DC60]
ILPRFS